MLGTPNGSLSHLPALNSHIQDVKGKETAICCQPFAIQITATHSIAEA